MQFVSERSSLQADLSNYLREDSKKANLLLGKKLLNGKKCVLLTNPRTLCTVNRAVLMVTADVHPFLLLTGTPVWAMLLGPRRGSQHFEALAEENKFKKSVLR